MADAPSRPARLALRDVGALLGLAAATLAVLWPLGLTNRVLGGIDAYTYFLPYWAYRMAAMRAGHIPLWNPYLFLGAPFLANPQAAVLYPLHWPLSWLAPAQALVWSALLHTWIAGAFTYAFARRSLRLSRPAAFLAGLLFGLGGYTIARLENINQLNAIAWFPAMLWLYDETVRAGDRRHALQWGAGLSATIALALLAGHTQTAFLDLAGLAVYAGAQAASAGWEAKRTSRLAGVWRSAGVRLLPLLAIVPAALLAAAQLLPTMELNVLGLRTGGLTFRQAVSFSLRPRLLLQSLLPPFAGQLGETFGSEGFAEFAGYLSMSALLLAGLGAFSLFQGRSVQAGTGVMPAAGEGTARGDPAAETEARRSAIALLWLAGAGLVLALGAYNPLYYVLWRFVPGFGLFRAPARWLALYALGAAGLAGLGLDAVVRLRPRFALSSVPVAPATRRRWLPVILAVAALALLLTQQWPPWRAVAGWLVAALFTAGLCWLARTRPAYRSPARAALIALVLAELWVGARALPFAQATAPVAADGMRNAPATLLAATATQPPAGRDRFLSLSDIRFDPGDLAELRGLEADRLPADAVERLVRTAKQMEVLAPNLSLLWQLPAVDGYDGGLLPLARYVKLQSLFLPPGELSPDGRLREQLHQIPPGRLLDLTGTRYLITDKQNDLWAGDVYYDLEQAAALQPGQTLTLDLSNYPLFSATSLGVVSYLAGKEPAPGPVAEIELVDRQGRRVTLPLLAGADTASPDGDQAPGSPVLARKWPDWMGQGQDYLAVKDFASGHGCPAQPGSDRQAGCPFTPSTVRITALPALAGAQSGEPNSESTAADRLVVRGLSLIDRRTGAHQSITVSPGGDFRRIYSGDVKIYERQTVPGRAWLVHDAQPVPDDAAALQRMGDPRFDPRATALVTGGTSSLLSTRLPASENNSNTTGDRVTVVVYEPERVVIRTESNGPALLVMPDSVYPGWQATVDGQHAPLLTTDLMFRGVSLDSGPHEVALTYRPTAWRFGLAISLFAAALLLGSILVTQMYKRRSKA